MSQFLGLVIFLIIATGLAIQSGLELPWFLEWMGKLPGDILIKKGNITYYAPLTSSVLISVVLSFFFSFFSAKK